MSFTATLNWLKRDSAAQEFLTAAKAGDEAALGTALVKNPDLTAPVGENSETILMKALTHIFLSNNYETQGLPNFNVLVDKLIEKQGQEATVKLILDTIIDAPALQPEHIQKALEALDGKISDWLEFSTGEEDSSLLEHLDYKYQVSFMDYNLFPLEGFRTTYLKAETAISHLRDKGLELTTAAPNLEASESAAGLVMTEAADEEFTAVGEESIAPTITESPAKITVNGQQYALIFVNPDGSMNLAYEELQSTATTSSYVPGSGSPA